MSKVNKKLFNNVNNCVDESLKGFCLLYPGLKLHTKFRFISKKRENVTSKVGLLSGGGSGHEPFSAGYVGNGMLSGSVSGSIFASPPKANILYGIRYLNELYKGGIIVIIPNYTGDSLNFGMAVEQAKSEGIPVESITFGEDCASGSHSIAGNRGMCGIIIAYKICGGLSSDGKNLQCIMETLNSVHKNISTIGISVEPCSLPGQTPLFSIADDELELGTGVHGEAGICRIKHSTAKDIVNIMLDKLCKALNLQSGNSLVLFINNLGASSQLEQNIICYEVYYQLNERNLIVERIYSGLCFTSLDMAGFQVCILNLPSECKYEWLKHLDGTTDSPSWTGCSTSIPLGDLVEEYIEISYITKPVKKSNIILSHDQKLLFRKCLEAGCQRVIENEIILNNLDKGCGDGDCGTTLKNLAEGVIDSMNKLEFLHPERVLKNLSEIAESKMGGTSGAIYSLCFTAMSKFFSEYRTSESKLLSIWIKALKEGVDTVMKYSKAQLGDRSIIDAVKPTVDFLFSKCELDLESFLKDSVQVSKDCCKKTKEMKARAGRASYVSEEYLKDVDAGAYGFVILFEAIINTLI